MDEQKQMLDVNDIRTITGLGRAKAYELMNSGKFHVVKIGNRKFVHREVLEKWLKGENGKKKMRI
jgi:predicted DNA-binding transcriptional regulator AlpA